MSEEATRKRDPGRGEWLDDVDFDVVTIRRYDTNDVIVGTQNFVLMRDEGLDGDSYIVSSIASPLGLEED